MCYPNSLRWNWPSEPLIEPSLKTSITSLEFTVSQLRVSWLSEINPSPEPISCPQVSSLLRDLDKVSVAQSFFTQLGEGNFAKSENGVFIHTGGWLFVHENNTVEVNLLECVEKEHYSFDQINAEDSIETESAAGKVAHQLQQKAVKLINRRRWFCSNSI